ncbi:MAG: hypothetical protein SVM79_01050 [Chloroflexota bacterium]|nr:hypothetical protein [Chloroflexota bacterium]
MANDTLPKLLKRNAEISGDKRCFRKKDFGIWRVATWSDYYENVKNLSLGLMAPSLELGERVAIIGENNPQWY